MDSICERQRQLHEEIEFLEKQMENEMLETHLTHKDKVNSEHRVKRMMEKVSEKSQRLLSMYEDKDGFRGEELRLLSSGNPLREFNMRLQSLREYHRRHPGEKIEPLKAEILVETPLALGSLHTERYLEQLAVRRHDKAAAKVSADAVLASTLPTKYAAQIQEGNLNLSDFKMEAEKPMLVDFSDEEGFGKFLDLHAAHTMYINLKGVLANDYITYLQTFDNFAEIPRTLKITVQYKSYLEQLFSYLLDFFARSRPLFDVDKEIHRIDDEFEGDWVAGICPGWGKPVGAIMDAAKEPLDLTPYNSAEELEALGGDRLKEALTALGLKCGGTVQQRAQRLFVTKNTPFAALDKSLFVGDTKKERFDDGGRPIAAIEFRISHLMKLLNVVRRHTIEHVELRMSRTAGELEEEDVADLPAVDEEDEEETRNDLPYNPKGLPLGWDGKPIPYWLYKLHGLNVKYNCEICGDQKYMGPKAFQKHFQEWKHAAGMRSLGIPNTAHFAYVTKMEDAINLWEKLKKDKALEVFQAQYEEEFEDTQGNVVDKKTFELLAKQGLL